MSNTYVTTSAHASSSGIGLGGLLAILFIGLKLCHVIDWAWFWVLAPVWIPFGMLVALVPG